MGAPPRSPAFSISTWPPNAPFYWRRYGGSLWLSSARLRRAERPRASGAESLRSGGGFPSTTSPIPQFFGGPCSSTPGADQASFRFSFFGTALHAASIGSSASNPILRGTYAKLPINLGNRPRVRQEHFPNFLGPKSDHNGFFYGR